MAPLDGIEALKVVYDLALARCGPAQEEEKLVDVRSHAVEDTSLAAKG
jgi:hypothetical protein